MRAAVSTVERTDVTPASIVLDEPETFEFDDQVWMPANYQDEYEGPITLRRALAMSRNLATIHVAQMAGLPGAVITRATEVLATLEAKAERGKLGQLADHLPDFTAQPPVTTKTLGSELEKLLENLKPDELAPKEALELIYRIKALFAA